MENEENVKREPIFIDNSEEVRTNSSSHLAKTIEELKKTHNVIILPKGSTCKELNEAIKSAPGKSVLIIEDIDGIINEEVVPRKRGYRNNELIVTACGILGTLALRDQAVRMIKKVGVVDFYPNECIFLEEICKKPDVPEPFIIKNTIENIPELFIEKELKPHKNRPFYEKIKHNKHKRRKK